MASLNFQAQLKRGDLIIRMICQTNTHDRKFLNTGFKLPATKVRGIYKFWDNSKQRAKQGAQNFEELNEYLQAQEGKFNDYLKECKARNRSAAIDELTALLTEERKVAKRLKILKPVVKGDAKSSAIVGVIEQQNTVIDLGVIEELTPALKLYVEFSREKAGDVKRSTFKPYKTFGEQLKQFEKQRSAGPINLNNVDVKFYKEFTTYLIHQQNNVNSTINRKVKRLKTFLSWCMEEGHINVGTFKKKYKLDEVEASKFPLYREEKELLYKYIPQAGTESVVYWAFRFALCTGLRFSDISQVKPANIHYMDNKGEKLYYLTVVEQKTSERTTVPLSKMALEILSKAKAHNNGVLFKLPSDQECNRTLKDIGRSIGLDRICEVKQFQGKELISEYLPLKEMISFHYARYTYITELLNSGLAPIYVQNNVGHNKLETTLEYNRDIDKDRLINTLLIQEKIA